MSEVIRCRLRALSPVHVGSGKTLTRLDYAEIESRFHVLDVEGILKDPALREKRETFHTFAMGNRKILDWCGAEAAKRHTLYALPIATGAIGPYRAGNEVREQIKSTGRAFVPGSSIKGALLSALLWHAAVKGRIPAEPVRRVLSSAAGAREPHQLGKLLDGFFGELAARPAPAPRFSPWISVSDSEVRPAEEVLEATLSDVEDSLKKNLSVPCEAIRPGAEFTFTVHPPLKGGLGYGPSQILEAAREFYREVARASKAAVREEEIGLRLGSGSGRFSTSLILLARAVNFDLHLRAPKTRKVDPAKRTFGWCAVQELT